MEARDTKYLLLDDGRKLCLECHDSAITDTHECQPLYLEIQDFYEGLRLDGILFQFTAYNLILLCKLTLAELRCTKTKVGAGRLTDMFTEPYKVVRQCAVTAILILYSVPRLLTDSILAHEMIHPWIRLKGAKYLLFIQFSTLTI
uniref:protein DA1-related 1-like n=1 Tax=Erigeron canadensis TaxID=72917 RepID=UPI001CB9560E|nr:protein DA1-related 1-like [Erigeron canadensis]